MNVAARASVEEDGPALVVIADAIREELAPLRGGAVLLAQRDRRALADAGPPADDTATSVSIYVGTIDDVVVGFATVAIEPLLDGSRLGVIRELGVLLGARGVGVGEAILDEVVAHCRQQRCRGIDSYALPGTRETKNFFETFGFTARLLVVHSNLEATTSDGPEDPSVS